MSEHLFFVTLVDGPAMTTIDQLQLRRCPRYMRGVVTIDGGRDALDQVDDTVDLGDELHVYAIEWIQHRVGHVRQGPGRSFWMGRARYRHLPQFDAGALGLADNEKWQAFAMTLPDDPREAIPLEAAS